MDIAKAASAMTIAQIDESHLVKYLERKMDIELTEKEIEDGFFIDIVLGKCNIRKTLEEKNKSIREEHEAFNRMHNADGIVGKSNSTSRL